MVDYFFVNNDGIVHVATFDEVGFKQRLDVAHKHKCTCRSNLSFKIIERIECGKLAINELRIERTHRRYAKLVVGKDGDARTRSLVFHLNLMPNDVVIFGYALLLDAHTLNLFHIHDGRTIENGEFRAVNLYETVVDTHSVERRKAMLYGGNAYIAIGKYSAALRVYHPFGQRIDDGLTFQINSLYLIACVFGCRIEGYREAQSGMQAFAIQGKAAFQCCLF